MVKNVMWIERPRRERARPPEHPEQFSGTVHFQVLHRAETSDAVDVLIVSFESGARTRPHIHAGMQVLHIIEGEGVVATRAERRLVRVGDIVAIPPGEWHWHGATTTSAMTHVAVKPPGPTEWNPPLLDWATYMEGVRP